MSIDLKISESHLPKLKEAYRGIYAEFMSRYIPIINEWNELYPILKQLGILDEMGTPKDKINSQPVAIQAVLSGKLNEMRDSKLDIFRGNKVPLSTNGFQKNWTWAQKATYILEKAGRPMTSKEIAEVLVNEYEKDLNLPTAINSVPATLSVAAREGKFTRRLNEKGEYEYDIK
jgi:hypothetical protein